MSTANELDSFNDMTPIEVPAAEDSGGAKTSPELDSFDDMTPVTEVPVEKKEKDEIDKDSQVNQLDNKEDDDEVKEAEKLLDKKKEEAPKIPEKKEDEPPADAKPSGKAIRVKDGDKTLDISPDATIPVKVKGKKEFVSIEELRKDYSGREAWGEKIKQAEERETVLVQRETKFKEEFTQVASQLSKIRDLIDNSEDPLAPLLFLVESSGRNVLDYTKKVYDHLAETVHELDEMDDVERQLYWRDRELQFLKNNQTAKAELEKKQNADKELQTSMSRLLESRGVSREQYDQAQSDLEKLYPQYKGRLAPEKIAEYAQVKPALDKSEGLCRQFEDDLTDDQMDELVTAVAKTLRDYPKITDEKAVKIAAQLLGWNVEDEDSDIEILNSKASAVSTPASRVVNNNDGSKLEMFDDFDL